MPDDCKTAVMRADLTAVRRSRSFAKGLSATEVTVWTAALLTMILLPLFLVRYPGMQDYPNHLARGFILLNPDNLILQKLYSVKWAMVPNLGWDIWIKLVGQILPIEAAGKVFIVVAEVSILGGCFVLNRALVSRFTYAPLLAGPLLLNAGFIRGFLSFDLGTGCALFASAWWVATKRTHWLRRIAFATIFSTALYFVHFYAWAFYGLFVLCYEVQQKVERRKPSFVGLLARLGRDSLQALPVLFIIVYSAASSAPAEFFVRKFEFPYVRILQMQHLIGVGDPVISFALVMLFFTFMGVVLGKLNWLRVTTDCATLIAVSIALFFLLPDQIAGTSYVSWRILFLGSLVGISSLEPYEFCEKRQRSVLVFVGCMIAFASTLIVWNWRNAEQGREAFTQLMQDVPEGKEIFIVHSGTTPRQLERHAMGLFHVGAYAVLTRHALVQSMFTAIGQQPLEFRKELFQSVPRNSDTFLSDVKREFRKDGLDLASHIMQFDYVVVHGPDYGDDLLALSQPNLTLMDQALEFRLYKVNKP